MPLLAFISSKVIGAEFRSHVGLGDDLDFKPLAEALQNVLRGNNKSRTCRWSRNDHPSARSGRYDDAVWLYLDGQVPRIMMPFKYRHLAR